MTEELVSSRPGWGELVVNSARQNKFTALGLGIALLGILVLLLQSLFQITGGTAPDNLRLAMLGGAAGFATTALGALPAMFLRGLPQRLEDSLLGLAAGMMLAASAFSLLLPGLAAGAEILGSKPLSAGVVVLGMSLGVLLMLGLDAFLPHEHESTGPCGPGADRCRRIWLFVFAIAVHNLPEGMAIGVSFANADMSVGVPLTTAIALQDIPEGLAVALPCAAPASSPASRSWSPSPAAYSNPSARYSVSACRAGWPSPTRSASASLQAR